MRRDEEADDPPFL